MLSAEYIRSIKEKLLACCENPDDLKEFLSQENIGKEDYNMIYSYYFPENIGDRELPGIINKSREQRGFLEGFLQPDPIEIGILTRAYSTRQYNRYMLHLLNSFINHSDKIQVEGGEGQHQCGVCGKNVFCYDSWDLILKQNPTWEAERTNRQYLSFTSDYTNQRICINCLIQLRGLWDWIETLKQVKC